MRAGGRGGVGVGGSVKQWGALMLWDIDLWKLSILIRVVLTRFLALLAVRRWHRSVGKAINGDVVDGKIRDG